MQAFGMVQAVTSGWVCSVHLVDSGNTGPVYYAQLTERGELCRCVWSIRWSWAGMFRAFGGGRGSWAGVFGAFGGERGSRPGVFRAISQKLMIVFQYRFG